MEPEGQRFGVLGTGAGQRSSAGVIDRDPFAERASPEELGDGQRVSPPLAGKGTVLGCTCIMYAILFTQPRFLEELPGDSTLNDAQRWAEIGLGRSPTPILALHYSLAEVL